MLVTKASQPRPYAGRRCRLIGPQPASLSSCCTCSGASVDDLILQLKFWNRAFAFRSDLAMLAIYLRTLPRVARRHHTLPTHLP